MADDLVHAKPTTSARILPFEIRRCRSSPRGGRTISLQPRRFDVASTNPRIILGRGWVARVGGGHIELTIKSGEALRSMEIDAADRLGIPIAGFHVTWCDLRSRGLFRRHGPFSLLLTADGALQLGPKPISCPWRTVRRMLCGNESPRSRVTRFATLFRSLVNERPLAAAVVEGMLRRLTHVS